MAKLIVLEVPGLTMEMVQRGDRAVHLFDLIADGALAELDGLPPRVEAEWIVDRRGLDSIDGEIPGLRARGALAIVSERVFIAPRPIREIGPGTKLTAAQAAGHLRRLADGA